MIVRNLVTVLLLVGVMFIGNLLPLTTGVSVGLHRPELEEDIQSQAEHQTEDGEGCHLCRVAAGNEMTSLSCAG